MPYLKPLPKELFDKLKKDIENTMVNWDLVDKCKNIMDEIKKKHK